MANVRATVPQPARLPDQFASTFSRKLVVIWGSARPWISRAPAFFSPWATRTECPVMNAHSLCDAKIRVTRFALFCRKPSYPSRSTHCDLALASPRASTTVTRHPSRSAQRVSSRRVSSSRASVHPTALRGSPPSSTPASPRTKTFSEGGHHEAREEETRRLETRCADRDGWRVTVVEARGDASARSQCVDRDG